MERGVWAREMGEITAVSLKSSLEVDTPIDYRHPLIDNYRIFRDDPIFEEYVMELKVIRAEANAV